MTITDRLIAPNATRSEAALCYSAAAVGAVTAGLLAKNSSVLVIVVVTLVGFDLFGGAVVNATASAKRWFHRPGRDARHHLAFVAIHVQPFLLALVVPGFGWWTAAAIYGFVLAAAVVVTSAPDALRTPIAFAATVFGVAITTHARGALVPALVRTRPADQTAPRPPAAGTGRAHDARVTDRARFPGSVRSLCHDDLHGSARVR
ncbi:hypothetical protein [Nocardia sp. NPDC058705]|uniref:hypothetical protein n=1 Tax=Nocardia sp. NPDC058705 TaxID=3346609 RepID=UPI003686637C